jgi:hypothetical protein
VVNRFDVITRPVRSYGALPDRDLRPDWEVLAGTGAHSGFADDLGAVGRADQLAAVLDERSTDDDRVGDHVAVGTSAEVSADDNRVRK